MKGGHCSYNDAIEVYNSWEIDYPDLRMETPNAACFSLNQTTMVLGKTPFHIYHLYANILIHYNMSMSDNGTYIESDTYLSEIPCRVKIAGIFSDVRDFKVTT